MFSALLHRYGIVLALLFSGTLPLQASVATGTSGAGPLDVLLVIGAPGEPEYALQFAETAAEWTKACDLSGRTFRVLDAREGGTNQLAEFTEIVRREMTGEKELWVVLIGHGTFDGKEAKFNMAGADLSARDAAELLKEFKRPLVFINCSSSSAPFLPELSGPNRIVLTATKSGYEENYSYFGKFLSGTIADLAADLDKDGQVSVLEAFISASRQTDEFYKTEKRLATEHALLDDNGDGKGTPASFFKGVRPIKEAEDRTALDGFRAHQLYFAPNEEEALLTPAQRQRRNELEELLEKMRGKKQELPEDEYLDLIEPILLELSRLYEEASK